MRRCGCRERLIPDVSEQNPQAAGFSVRQGFVAVGRSETDGEGRPFPLLHLNRHRNRPFNRD
jgi:putative acetyltransferase